jgi:glycosyltransferase involved in cell wall biosynthesis
MKVLIVHDYGVLVGGAENVSVMLRDGLRRRGHDARLFASTARPLPLPNVADYTCFGTTSSARKLLQVANPSAVRRLRRVLREFAPDVVHVRMFNTQLSPLILQPLVRHRTLLHVGGYELICPLLTKTLPDGAACHSKPGMACYRAGCVPLLGAARTLVQARLRQQWQDGLTLKVPNSDWVRRRLIAEGIDAGEAVLNGVPVCPARPPLTDPPAIAFAGRLVPKKGVGVLLEAMTRVVAEMPEARLLVAGGGPDRRSVEENVAALRLASNVVMLGHRPRSELEHLLAGAWVQAVPSQWEEPFGNAAAEAMMRGTAVVATDTGGLSELVEDGVTGFLVPCHDARALAQALLRVLGDARLAERLGAQARAAALATLSDDRMLDRFLELYEQLLRQPAA